MQETQEIRDKRAALRMDLVKVLEQLVALDGPNQLMSEVHSALAIAEIYGDDETTIIAMEEQVAFIKELIEANAEEEQDADAV